MPAFWIVGGAFLINMLGTTLPTPLYPIYAQRFHFSALLVTVIFAVYAFGVIAGLLLFGHLSDEIGRRRVLVPALALSALSAVAFLLANDLPLIFAARILSGLSAGIFTGTGTAMMTELAPKERRAFATAAAVAVNAVGLSLGPLFAGLLAQYVALPLRVPYALDLALLVPATLGMLAVPETVQPRSHKLRLRIQHMRVPEEIRGVFIRASIVGICGFAVTGVFSAVAPSILRQVLHEPAPALAGLLVCLILGTASIGQFAVHRIPDRFAFPAGCGLLLAGLGFLAVSIAAKSTALLFLSSVAAGVGWGIVVGFGLTQINTRVHERRGEVTSAYFVMLYAGLSFPVIGVGVAVAALGLSTAGILFSGIVGAVVLAVLLNSLSTTGELRESR